MAGKPTYQMEHIDVALTNLSVAYTPSGFIADQVFPNVPVQKISDLYFIYTKADWLRREADVRAPGTRAARGDYGLSTSNYVCVERAIAKAVPDEIVANADSPLRPLEDATRWCTTQIQLQVESVVAGKAFGSGWSSSVTPGTLWSNDASDPLGDLETGMSTVVGAIGLEANTGVVGRGLWRYLKNHPDIVDRIKYSAGPNSPAIVTVQAVAALVGVEKLLVGIAIEETGREGATSSLAYIWGNHMLLAYVTGGPSLLAPSAGYIFNYQQRQVSRFREEQERADVVEARQSWDVRNVAADAAYFIKSAA